MRMWTTHAKPARRLRRCWVSEYFNNCFWIGGGGLLVAMVVVIVAAMIGSILEAFFK